MLTGCTHVQPSGIGFTDKFAAYDDRFIPSLRKLAQAAKSGGAPAVLQIFHAGNKAVPSLIPKGELVSASSLAAPKGPFNDGKLASRALSHEEILAVIRDFGEATRRAIEAGFDGVELHGAHGFLIQNFLSPLFNQRTDSWGGSLENRMRFPLEVVREVRRVIAAHAKRPFLLGYRISPEEPGEGALRICGALALVDRSRKARSTICTLRSMTCWRASRRTVAWRTRAARRPLSSSLSAWQGECRCWPRAKSAHPTKRAAQWLLGCLSWPWARAW